MLETLLLKNYMVYVSLLAYTIAQVSKTILYSIMNKKFDPRRLVGSGGMPSSHSATVAALAAAAIKACGPDSSVTAISLIFAVIVIHDAVGVRQQTGKHAQLLNILLKKEEYAGDFNVHLNEMVGHTGLQALVGTLIGIAVALLMPLNQ